MPVNLSIKNAPDDMVTRLRERAVRNHRSLQGEMLAILEEAVTVPRKSSVDEVLARIRALGIESPAEAVDIIRVDRDGR